MGETYEIYKGQHLSDEQFKAQGECLHEYVDLDVFTAYKYRSLCIHCGHQRQKVEENGGCPTK